MYKKPIFSKGDRCFNNLGGKTFEGRKMDKLREGDFIETEEGLFFGVKGLLHPPDRIFAFLRYVPSPNGERKINGTNYRKIYPLEDRFEYLRNKYPEYISYSEKLDRKIQTVPINKIKKVYQPEKRIAELKKKKEKNLNNAEKKAVYLSNSIVEESGIKNNKIGITGSILVGLDKPDSDIDLVIYGEKEGRKSYSALKKLKKNREKISGYNKQEAIQMAKFRWGNTGLPIEKLADIEKEKVLHGKIGKKDFFLRLVKDWNDIETNYRDVSYSRVGKSKIEGTVSDATDSIFTPNTYEIKKPHTLNGDDYRIEKITSYRGRFTEQANEGEKIRAKGRVEKVCEKEKEYYRMILGKPEEFLIPIDFFQ